MHTEESRRAFHRAANAIFGCIGRVATEDVVLQLLHSKCIPILLYGLEACPLVIEPILVLNLVRARSSWLGIGTEPPADRSPIRRRIV